MSAMTIKLEYLIKIYVIFNIFSDRFIKNHQKLSKTSISYQNKYKNHSFNCIFSFLFSYVKTCYLKFILCVHVYIMDGNIS